MCIQTFYLFLILDLYAALPDKQGSAWQTATSQYNPAAAIIKLEGCYFNIWMRFKSAGLSKDMILEIFQQVQCSKNATAEEIKLSFWEVI